jgi:hypothetical protein
MMKVGSLGRKNEQPVQKIPNEEEVASSGK